MKLVQVAVPVPALDPLTYSVPEGDPPPVGARVVVPVGARTMTGIVVDHPADSSFAGKEVRPLAASSIASRSFPWR